MTRSEFNQHVEGVFARTSKVLLKKGNEYSTEENVFHNFESAVGLSLHNGSTSVAWEFVVKHLQSIKDILREVEYKNYDKLTTELIDEKFGDAENYFILIEGMLKQLIAANKNKKSIG